MAIRSGGLPPPVVVEGAWQRGCRLAYLPAMNYRTKAEFFIQGITKGVIDAPEVIAWADEVIVSAPKTEDWMLDISTCGPEDRLVVLSHLNTVKGEADAAARRPAQGARDRLIARIAAGRLVAVERGRS